MGSVTIEDVAALAGVSMKTVSRVVNGEPHVRPAMREKVLSAVEELNYRPNFAARALAGSRAYVLGLYFDNPSSGYVGAIQAGAMKGCREAGYHLLVEQIDSDRPGGREQVMSLLSTVKMDGLILSPPVCDRSEVLEVLEQRDMPYVRIAPAREFERGPYVHMDDRRAAYEMTARLLRLGHRRIGFVKGHATHSATPLRYAGYLEAMRDAGIEMRPEWVQPGAFTFRSGAGAAERLLNLPERPTAIFASNDDMALGVMAVANRMQLNVPKELSVTGFDDSPIAQVVWPQLTTIRQPVEQMAYEAATMLIQDGEGAKARLLEFTLVERESTGVAPD